MPAYCVIELLSRVFYSCGREKYPMYAAAAGMITGILSSLLFLAADSLTVTTIALSNAIGQGRGGAPSAFFCRGVIPDMIRKEDIRKAVGTAFSFALSAAAMAVLHRFLIRKIVNFALLGNFIIIAIVFLTGIVVYLICMISTKSLMISPSGWKRGENARGRRR